MVSKLSLLVPDPSLHTLCQSQTEPLSEDRILPPLLPPFHFAFQPFSLWSEALPAEALA